MQTDPTGLQLIVDFKVRQVLEIEIVFTNHVQILHQVLIVPGEILFVFFPPPFPTQNPCGVSSGQILVQRERCN